MEINAAIINEAIIKELDRFCLGCKKRNLLTIECDRCFIMAAIKTAKGGKI